MFKVVPNFLPQQEFDKTFGMLNNDPSIPWYYVRGTSDFQRDWNDNHLWNHSFAHTAYDPEFGTTSRLGELCVDFVEGACRQLDISLAKILRIRFGLITKTPEPVEHGAHVDFNQPHVTLLYYLTTCNGPTIMYDQCWPDAEPSTLTEWRRIPAEANKLVAFDGRRYHSSVSQTDTKQRIAININIEVN